MCHSLNTANNCLVWERKENQYYQNQWPLHTLDMTLTPKNWFLKGINKRLLDKLILTKGIYLGLQQTLY